MGVKNFKQNDKLVFLGNVIGLGDKTKETLSSIINLRFNLMSKFKLKPEEIVFLRGAQEEMVNKLLQLHIAPNPIEIINWMFDHGVDKTLNSYGFKKEEIVNIASSGTVSIQSDAASGNMAFTRLNRINVTGSAVLHVGAGTTFKMNVLDLF